MSNRWQMLAGLSRAAATAASTTAAPSPGPASARAAANDPTASINRDDGSVFIDLPWIVQPCRAATSCPGTTSCSPAKYTARAGDPLNRSNAFTFTGLDRHRRPSTTVRARAARRRTAPRPCTSSSTCGSAKRFRIGTRRASRPTIDLFNVLNANHVLLQNERLGTTWARPTRILTPRIIRFGVDRPVLGWRLGGPGLAVSGCMTREGGSSGRPSLVRS